MTTLDRLIADAHGYAYMKECRAALHAQLVAAVLSSPEQRLLVQEKSLAAVSGLGAAAYRLVVGRDPQGSQIILTVQQTP